MKPERRTLPRPRLDSPDSAELKGNGRLTGLVRTSRGYAVAFVELAADGTVVSARLGPSQTEKRFVAIEHKREVIKAAMQA